MPKCVSNAVRTSSASTSRAEAARRPRAASIDAQPRASHHWRVEVEQCKSGTHTPASASTSEDLVPNAAARRARGLPTPLVMLVRPALRLHRQPATCSTSWTSPSAAAPSSREPISPTRPTIFCDLEFWRRRPAGQALGAARRTPTKCVPGEQARVPAQVRPARGRAMKTHFVLTLRVVQLWRYDIWPEVIEVERHYARGRWPRNPRRPNVGGHVLVNPLHLAAVAVGGQGGSEGEQRPGDARRALRGATVAFAAASRTSTTRSPKLGRRRPPYRRSFGRLRRRRDDARAAHAGGERRARSAARRRPAGTTTAAPRIGARGFGRGVRFEQWHRRLRQRPCDVARARAPHGATHTPRRRPFAVVAREWSRASAAAGRQRRGRAPPAPLPSLAAIRWGAPCPRAPAMNARERDAERSPPHTSKWRRLSRSALGVHLGRRLARAAWRSPP